MQRQTSAGRRAHLRAHHLALFSVLATLSACEPLPTFLPPPLEPTAGSIEVNGVLMPTVAALVGNGKLVLATTNGELQVVLEPQGFELSQFPLGEIDIASPTRAGAQFTLLERPTLPLNPPPDFNPDTVPWTNLNASVRSGRVAMTQSTANVLQGWFDVRIETAADGVFRLRGRFWGASGSWQQCDDGRLIPAGLPCTPGPEASR